MKSAAYILILSIPVLQSCGKVMDKPPLDKISQDVIWNDQTMTTAYVTNLYTRINFYGFEQIAQFSSTDEASTNSTNNTNINTGTVSKTSEYAPYWDYTYIRDCAFFLDQMKTSKIPDTVKTQLSGEVRFMRAFAYFEMMKRYGGVPLVDVVLDPYKPVDDKYTTRAKEADIAGFIDNELTLAESELSDAPAPRGKINKWTAYALQARAMLWAASIAKYGTVQLDGIVGIPAAQANAYYAKASAAANQVITSGKYSLYNPLPSNKAESYRLIFMDKENSEVIFEKAYDGINVTNDFDAQAAPQVFANRGAYVDPTLGFILGYENIDGSTDAPVFGQNALYDNGTSVFAKKDPRLFGTVFFQSDKWSIGTIQSYDGLDTNAAPDFSKILSSNLVTYHGIKSVGDQSRKYANVACTPTGFTVKKYIDGSKYQIGENLSKTNWICFRLAEMYLTRAEAEFEQGNLTPAVEALNMTRARAGISLVTEGTITLDKVRTERRSELAFEGHRFWDLRRWRAAQAAVNGVTMQGLHITWHYPTGKYYFIPFNAENFTRSFPPQQYYNPITSARIDNNPKLIENPLY